MAEHDDVIREALKNEGGRAFTRPTLEAVLNDLDTLRRQVAELEDERADYNTLLDAVIVEFADELSDHCAPDGGLCYCAIHAAIRDRAAIAEEEQHGATLGSDDSNA